MSGFEPIKLVEVVADEVGTPRDDGTPGSALYSVPIQLSSRPPSEWAQIFISTWDRPPSFTSMHRPGIASIVGDRVVLNGTTLDEIERYHRATLLVVVTETNRKYGEFLQRSTEVAAKEAERVRLHQDEVRRKSKDIRFD
jgi:hypothetical protein